MNTEHTPGPWQHEYAGCTNDKGEFEITECFVRRDGDDIAIAGDISDPITGKMSEVNARLIAAAPDLLEALEKILEYTDEMDGHEDWPPLRKAAESAIAKARGKEGV